MALASLAPYLDSLLTLISQRSTRHKNAWQNRTYETYVLNFSIPAVRLHQRGASSTGDWYAVDEYNLPIAAYRRRYAPSRSGTNGRAIVGGSGKVGRKWRPKRDTLTS